jgi:hypothetical protein
MQTSVGSASGDTVTDIYDSTTGTPLGLSNQVGARSANLVTASYDTHAQLAALNLLASDGSALASDAFTYDSNLRPIGTTALWQRGSGQSGTIFSQTTSYDAVGNVISQATNQAAVNGVSGSGGSEVENFCYTEQNDLVWAGNGGRNRQQVTAPVAVARWPTASRERATVTATSTPTWASSGRGRSTALVAISTCTVAVSRIT